MNQFIKGTLGLAILIGGILTVTSFINGNYLYNSDISRGDTLYNAIKMDKKEANNLYQIIVSEKVNLDVSFNNYKNDIVKIKSESQYDKFLSFRDYVNKKNNESENYYINNSDYLSESNKLLSLYIIWLDIFKDMKKDGYYNRKEYLDLTTYLEDNKDKLLNTKKIMDVSNYIKNINIEMVKKNDLYKYSFEKMKEYVDKNINKINKDYIYNREKKYLDYNSNYIDNIQNKNNKLSLNRVNEIKKNYKLLVLQKIKEDKIKLIRIMNNTEDKNFENYLLAYNWLIADENIGFESLYGSLSNNDDIIEKIQLLNN